MNTSNLAVMGPTERLPAATSETSAMISMFERLAHDPSVPMERIERVMDMIRDLRREQAEEDFNEAMAAAQQEMTPIARDSFNPQTRSKYASYAAIDKALRPIRTKYGLAVSFDEAMNDAPEGYIRVVAFVTKGRHTRTYHYDSPIITTGLQGKVNMTLTHARSSAVTYAKRYLMGMIFDLSTGDDVDGNVPTDTSANITALQLTEIENLIKEVNANEANVCKACKVESLAELTQAQFEKAMAKLETMRPPL
jgi:hypothetical protein